MKMKKLATSGTQEGITKLISEFYCTTPDRITLTWVGPDHDCAAGHWHVLNGTRGVTPFVVTQGRRYIFGVLASTMAVCADCEASFSLVPGTPFPPHRFLDQPCPNSNGTRTL